MVLDDVLRLSYYKEIADIEADHGVFLVQDIRTKKIYVKKVLSVYNSEIFRHLMEHPVAHTPKIYEMVEDRDVLVLIEEYIPGDTLQDLLDHTGTLAEPAVLDISIQLCRILESFHKCQPPIVNRDIKPSNIKLTGDGIVKLLDMNAAKRYKKESGKDTVLLGTQGYAAPEQYGFGSSSVLTDIYSVGILMNVLLTGKLSGGHIANGRLRQIISKCTELSPQNRYNSAAALRITLEALREKTNQQEKAAWRRFLPPGFRSDNPVNWFFAFVGYVFLLWLCWTLEVENAGIAELILNRVTVTVVSVGIVLFSGNYLDIQSKNAITGSKHIWLRLLGIVAVDIAILFFGIMVLSFAVSILV